MRIRSLSFNKRDLLKVPPHHRIAYFGLGQICDEASILLRMAIAAINSVKEHQATVDAACAAAMLATRMLAGRVYEARLFINGQEVARAFQELRQSALEIDLSVETEMTLAAAGRAALFDLTRSNSLLDRLRNRASFHVDPKLIEDSFHLLPDNHRLMDHLTAIRGNSVYGAAETLHLMALGQLQDIADPQAALNAATEEIRRAVGALTDFADGLLLAFAIVHLRQVVKLQTVELQALAVEDIRFPLFIEAEGYNETPQV